MSNKIILGAVTLIGAAFFLKNNKNKTVKPPPPTVNLNLVDYQAEEMKLPPKLTLNT